MQIQLKIFFKKLLPFLFIGILLAVLLFKTANKYDPVTDYRIRQILKNANSINAIAVGNSHSCAIDFQTLGMDGYRVALGGNDISEAVYQVESLAPLLPNLKTVFFNISYFSLFTDNSSIPKSYSIFNRPEYIEFIRHFPFAEVYIDTMNIAERIIIDTDKLSSVQKNKLGPALDVIMNNTSDRLKIRWSYYNSIPTISWISGDFINYLKSRLSILIRKDHWRDILTGSFTSRRHYKNNTVIDNYGQPNDPLRNSFKSEDSLNVLAKDFIVPMYQSSQQIVLINNHNVLNKNMVKLNSLIKYLKSHGISIIFYTSPVFKSFTEYFDQSTIRIMKVNMEFLKRKHQIEYFDFSKDSSISTNFRFFYNSDHLNKFGASMFSSKFRDVLESEKFILSRNQNSSLK